jgi:hypothetical protein
MVIGNRALSLISNEQCAVGQFDDRPDAMEPGNNGRKLDMRPSSEIEMIIPVP